MALNCAPNKSATKINREEEGKKRLKKKKKINNAKELKRKKKIDWQVRRDIVIKTV